MKKRNFSILNVIDILETNICTENISDKCELINSSNSSSYYIKKEKLKPDDSELKNIIWQ